MRNPFDLKNTVESDKWRVGEEGEGIAFEESLAPTDLQERLEREGDPKSQSRFLVFFLLGVLSLVLGRLYYLTVERHDYYAEIAKGNRLRVEYLPAPRGALYDRFGEVLAANKPSFELVGSPLDLPSEALERDLVVAKVAEILGMPAAEIESLVSGEEVKVYESVLIKQNLERDQALILHEQARDLPGFRVVNTPLRDYKQGPVFAHTIGYVGKVSAAEYRELASAGYRFNDFLGKTGLEQVYEAALRGQFGERQVEVDARGVVKKVFGEKEPFTGRSLRLNLDAGLQERLDQALRQRLLGINRGRGAAIIMEPGSGKILAYVSLPSFDNNLFAEGIDAVTYQKIVEDKNLPLFNRAIQGVYPPGSTIKPLVAVAALEEEIVTPKTLIDDSGQIVIRNPFGGPPSYFYNYNRRPLGLLDVRKAIAYSSDVFFYIVGGGYEPAKIEGLGVERLAGYFQGFGFGQKLGIDLNGEQEGLVPTPEWKKQRFADDPFSSRWVLGNTYNISIGQGDLLVTPLQLVSATAAIANGGKLYRPYLVDRIVDNEGNTTKQFAPEILRELGIEQEYLTVVREGMRRVVTEGTAKALNSLSIAVAGKTGTAQFDPRNPYRTHAWFAGFAPYANPEIAILVMIEDGGEGSVSAAPVASEVLEWWSRNRYNR